MTDAFNEIINNFENSLRGKSKVSGSLVKAFPHVAGSVFISKITSLLRTVVNEKSVYANLDEKTIKDRIYANGKALVLLQVLDEGVDLENMFFIFEGFQNITTDIYKGMKLEGKYGQLQKDLNQTENNFETEEELIS